MAIPTSGGLSCVGHQRPCSPRFPPCIRIIVPAWSSLFRYLITTIAPQSGHRGHEVNSSTTRAISGSRVGVGVTVGVGVDVTVGVDVDIAVDVGVEVGVGVGAAWTWKGPIFKSHEPSPIAHTTRKTARISNCCLPRLRPFHLFMSPLILTSFFDVFGWRRANLL